jgi:hypothetical protein
MNVCFATGRRGFHFSAVENLTRGFSKQFLVFFAIVFLFF